MPEKSVHIPVWFVVWYHCMSRSVYGNVGRIPHVGLTRSVSLVLPGLLEFALHFQCFSYFEAIQNTWCRSLWHCWCCWDTRRTARSTTTSSWSTSATSCRSRWSHRPSSSRQHQPLGRPGSRPILHSGLISFGFVWLAFPMQIQGDWPLFSTEM